MGDRVVEISGRKFGVVGLQRTGLAAARFLSERGGRVLAIDEKPLEELPEEVRGLSDESVEVVTGPQAYQRLQGCDVVIPSPGVPLESPALTLSRQLQIPIMAEIELAYLFCPGVLVAISGTKGKTTTATLLGEMLRASGIPVLVAGNIGDALTGAVATATEDHVIVAEVSSFQLETVDRFRPHIGLLLNLAPDHLDRHGSMENYAALKARLLQNQTDTDYAILNADDPNVYRLADQVQSHLIAYSTHRAVDHGIFVNGDGYLRSGIPHREGTLCLRREIALLGDHNVGNVLAASAAALLLGCDRETLVEVIRSFEGVPHRLEPVGEVSGVLCVNDSQATTPFAVLRALEAFDRPIHLIAGGRAKTNNFDELGDAIGQRCASVTCIGESAEKIAEVSRRGGMGDVRLADTLEQAIRDAFSRAHPGDVLLMSPACASFDMFRSYEHRGDVFRETVAALAAEQPPE